MSLIKKSDMKIVKNDFCGELLEILNRSENPELSIITLKNTKPTISHYHKNSQEIYWILEGSITLLLHDNSNNRTWKQILNEGDLFIVKNKIHHKINKSSGKNKICVISFPMWKKEDECKSDLA